MERTYAQQCDIFPKKMKREREREYIQCTAVLKKGCYLNLFEQSTAKSMK